jgi:hypothetical protein
MNINSTQNKYDPQTSIENPNPGFSTEIKITAASRRKMVDEWISQVENHPIYKRGYLFKGEEITHPPVKTKEILNRLLKEKKFRILNILYQAAKSEFEMIELESACKFQFLLDKNWFNQTILDLLPHPPMNTKNPYESGATSVNACFLSGAIEKLAIESNQDLHLSFSEISKLEKIRSLLLKSLNVCAQTDQILDNQLYFKRRDELETYFVEEVIELIKNPEINFPILIPCRTKTHCLSLAIEKKTDGKADIHVYNSGRGVLAYHYKRPSSNRYQTYLSIEDIQLDQLLDPIFWKNIVACTHQDVDLLYGELKKLGNPSLKSLFAWDYEQKQLQGTCSSQHLMAFFRHQIQKEMTGSPLDKIGAYKFLKASTICAMELNESKEPMFQSQINRKMRKVKGELPFNKIAAESDKFDQFYSSVLDFFEELQDKNLFRIVKEMKLKTTLEKYAFLHLCHRTFERKALENSQKFIELKTQPKYANILAVGISRAAYKADLKERIIDDLNEWKNKGQWGRLGEKFLQCYIAVDFYKEVEKWVISEVPPEKESEFCQGVVSRLDATSLHCLDSFVHELKGVYQRPSLAKILEEKKAAFKPKAL